MPERATVAQVVQLGVETVSGTAVAANKKLQALGFNLTPTIDTRLIRPAGSKYPTIAVPGKDWTSLAVGGEASYEDLLYAFSSVLKVPVTTGVGPYVHVFAPSITTADVVKTFTIEKGEEAAEAERVAGVQLTEFGFNFTRDAVEASGSAYGTAIEFDHDMTNTPTTLAITPIDPADVCLWWDATSAGLGTTKLLRVLNASWNITGRFNPLWVIDCAQPSYVASVEGVPDITASIRVEANDQGQDFVSTYMRNGTRGYLRIKADGGVPELQIDTAMVVTSVGELGDTDGVYAFDIGLSGVADGAWGANGKVTEVTLTNGLATL